MTLRDAMALARNPHNGRATSMAKAAKIIDVSGATLCRIVNRGEYPKKMGTEECQRRLSAFLVEHGVNPERVDWPEIRTKETLGHSPYLEKLSPEFLNDKEMTLMQLDRSTLALFGLRRNPFLNDVEADEDVFRHKGYTDVETAIREAIEERSFLALCGPSGSGKTTIWDGIQAEFAAQGDRAVFISPQVKAKDLLNADHLSRALLFGILGNDAQIKMNAEARGRQLADALRGAQASRTQVILQLDDAHFCNISVLRQLKTFYEEKVGRTRMITIILIGLPELKEKLGRFAEIGNRIRLVEVPPSPVQEYLAFKLGRVGSTIEKLFDADGLKAFLARFRRTEKAAAVGRPLIINATVIRAMVLLQQNGAQPGSKITREVIDQLPGESSARRVA